LTGLLARMEAKQVQAGFPAGFRMRDHRVFRGVLVREGVGWWACCSTAWSVHAPVTTATGAVSRSGRAASRAI